MAGTFWEIFKAVREAEPPRPRPAQFDRTPNLPAPELEGLITEEEVWHSQLQPDHKEEIAKALKTANAMLAQLRTEDEIQHHRSLELLQRTTAAVRAFGAKAVHDRKASAAIVVNYEPEEILIIRALVHGNRHRQRLAEIMQRQRKEVKELKEELQNARLDVG